MNASPCNYEQELMAALRSGPLSPELRLHVAGCAECSEVMMVAQFLQRDADSLREIPIPNGSLVWRRALSRSRAEATARAIRPIQWVIYAGFAVMIAAALWWILGLPAQLVRSATLDISSLQVVSGVWVVVSLAAGAVTILTALFGAVYILRAERVPAALAKN